MQQHQEPGRVGEHVHHEKIRLDGGGSELQRGGGDGPERGGERVSRQPGRCCAIGCEAPQPGGVAGALRESAPAK